MIALIPDFFLAIIEQLIEQNSIKKFEQNKMRTKKRHMLLNYLKYGANNRSTHNFVLNENVSLQNVPIHGRPSIIRQNHDYFNTKLQQQQNGEGEATFTLQSDFITHL